MRTTADWVVGKPIRFMAWVTFFPLGWYLTARHRRMELARKQLAATRALQQQPWARPGATPLVDLADYSDALRQQAMTRHPSSCECPNPRMN
jgi:hypothetical protein